MGLEGSASDLLRIPLGVCKKQCVTVSPATRSRSRTVQRITQDHNLSDSYQEVHGENIMIAALAFLFVVVGMQHVAQADDTKAAVEDMNGKANANAERPKVK